MRISVLLHNELGDGKTLLDPFCGLISMALARYLRHRDNIVVTTSQAANAVSNRLPSAAVSTVRLLKVPGSDKLICDSVCNNSSMKLTLTGISLKRRIEYSDTHLKLFDRLNYESVGMPAQSFPLQSKGYCDILRSSRGLSPVFGVDSKLVRESAKNNSSYVSGQLLQQSLPETSEQFDTCEICDMRYTGKHNCSGEPCVKDV